jgi:hypothetical protein
MTSDLCKYHPIVFDGKGFSLRTALLSKTKNIKSEKDFLFTLSYYNEKQGVCQSAFQNIFSEDSDLCRWNIVDIPLSGEKKLAFYEFLCYNKFVYILQWSRERNEGKLYGKPTGRMEQHGK